MANIESRHSLIFVLKGRVSPLLRLTDFLLKRHLVQEIVLVDALEDSWLVASHMTFLVWFNLDCRVVDVKLSLEELSDLVEGVTGVHVSHNMS